MGSYGDNIVGFRMGYRHTQTHYTATTMPVAYNPRHNIPISNKEITLIGHSSLYDDIYSINVIISHCCQSPLETIS